VLLLLREPSHVSAPDAPVPPLLNVLRVWRKTARSGPLGRTSVKGAGMHVNALFLGCFPCSRMRNKLGPLQELGALSLSAMVGGPIVLQPGLEATCGELAVVEVHSFYTRGEQRKNESNDPCIPCFRALSLRGVNGVVRLSHANKTRSRGSGLK
jgi:hypothetical protein